MSTRAATVVLLSTLVLAIHAQPPARDATALKSPGTASIRGRVITADTGAPLRNARVAISPDAGVAFPVFTDDHGRFSFAGLPAGLYTLTATKSGFATTRFGARRRTDRATPIEVARGAVVDGIDLRMPKGGVIIGRVVDDVGDPLILAFVAAQLIVRVDNRTDVEMMGVGETDDLGEYRIAGLPAGRYVVGLMTTSSTTIIGVSADGSFGPIGATLQRTYYPGGTGLAQAQPIAVRAGDEVPGIDFVARPVRPGTVSITVLDDQGRPADAELGVGSQSALVRSSPIHMGFTSARPTATTRLEPSDWVFFAHGPRGVALTRLSLGSDDAVVTMTLVKGGRISGRVIAESGSLPAGTRIALIADPVDPALSRAMLAPTTSPMKPDGTFELADLIGVRELRLAAELRGWIVKDVRLQGRSIADSPFDFKGGEDFRDVEVVLTNKHADLSGTVTDAGNGAVRDYSVLVFPESEERLRHTRRWAQWGRSNQDGRFAVDNLLPGAYLVVAVEDVDDADWSNADYLNQFRAQATRVILAEGEKKTLTLTLASVR
jgi:carboxypeptidase family protein